MFDNLSYNDYARMKQQSLNDQARKLQQKQAGLNAAQNKKTKTSLESALSGLVTGIGERIGDIGSTLNNIGKTVVGGINQIGQNKAIENTTKKDSERRNEIAKKYGFNSYSEAANSGKVGDDFWNEIKGSNEQTKKEQKEVTDKYRNTGKYGDVTKVNTNMAKGQALNTIDSVLGLIPGAGGVVANVAGGAIAGVGDEYKRAGREGGSFNLDNALKNAAIGGASGLAGSAGTAGLGKVANRFGGNAVGKALGSNLASGIAGGASAGGIGGALGTALNGGSLEDSLKAAWEGAKAGGIGGGVMAGTMGLGGTALEKLRNKKGTAKTPTAVEPVDAQIVQKNKIAQPQTRAIEAEIVEPVNNRRGIAIKDYDAGVEEIPVRTVADTQNTGKYIDSVVRRADANLPETKVPVMTPEDLALARKEQQFTMLQNTNPMADEYHTGIRSPEEINTLRDLVKNYDEDEMFTYPDFTYADAQKAANSPDITVYSSYPIEPGVFVSPSKMMAQDYATGNQNKIYQKTIPIDDFAAILSGDEGNYLPVAKTATKTPQKISIEQALTDQSIIPVTDRTTRYAESTLPARTYETPTTRANEVMNAEPTAVKPTPTTTAVAEPELDYATEVQRQKAQIAANKAKSEAVGGVVEQYGTTRLNDRIEGLPEAIEDMLKLGLTDRAEIDLYSSKMTGADSPIAKAIRKSLNDAEPIDGNWGFTWEDVFKAAGAAADKNAQGKITKFYEGQAAKHLRADENGLFNRNDVYDFGKALEKEGYKMRDRGERTQNNLNQVYGDALVNMSKDIIGKATDGVNPKGYLNLNELVKILPNNEEHAARMAELVNNGNTVQDLRSAMSSSTKMNRFKEAEEYNMNTYGQNQGDKGVKSAGTKVVKDLATGHPVKAIGDTAAVVAEKITGSDKAKQKAIKKSYENYKKYQAQANGEAPVNTNTGKLGAITNKAGNIAGGAKNIAGKAIGGVASIANKATTNLNNDMLANLVLGGSNTLGNQAQQFANKQMGKTEAERSEERLNNAQALANAQNEYNNALGDYQAQEALYNNQMAQLHGNTGTTSALNRIAKAMELAMNAGDLNAYSQLADLYTQAAKIAELQNPKKNDKALSANQAKALTAQQQLEALAQMTPDAGTVASGIPLIGGLVDLTGGNQYANQASSLATTLGYLLSGANIKESEAQRIGQAYVPTAFDSEPVRKQKLERARQLIQSYMSDTGAIEA